MTSSRYRRDFSDRSYFGGLITRDQLNDGNARDGYPGLQQALHNEIVDYDDHRAGIMKDTFNVTYSGGNAVISDGIAIFNGALTDISGGVVSGVADGDYIYLGFDFAYHKTSSISDVNGFLLGRVSGTAVDNEYKPGVRVSSLIDNKYGRIGYVKEFIPNIITSESINMMGILYERYGGYNSYKIGNTYYVSDYQSFENALNLNIDNEIIIVKDINVTGSVLQIQPNTTKSIHSSCNCSINGDVEIHLHGDSTLYMKNIFISGNLYLYNEGVNNYIDICSVTLTGSLNYINGSGAIESVPSGAEYDIYHHFLSVKESKLGGVILQVGVDLPPYTVVNPYFEFKNCNISGILSMPDTPSSPYMVNPKIIIESCYLRVYPQAYDEFAQNIYSGSITSTLSLQNSYVYMTSTTWGLFEVLYYNSVLINNNVFTFVHPEGSSPQEAILIQSCDKVIMVNNNINEIFPGGTNDDVSFVYNNTVLLKNNLYTSGFTFSDRGNTYYYASDNHVV